MALTRNKLKHLSRTLNADEILEACNLPENEDISEEDGDSDDCEDSFSIDKSFESPSTAASTSMSNDASPVPFDESTVSDPSTGTSHDHFYDKRPKRKRLCQRTIQNETPIDINEKLDFIEDYEDSEEEFIPSNEDENSESSYADEDDLNDEVAKTSGKKLAKNKRERQRNITKKLTKNTDKKVKKDNNFGWKKQDIVIDVSNQNFDVQAEPTHQFSRSSKTVEYFERFFTEEVIRNVVDQTNIYAADKKAHNWKDTDSNEVRALLGMLIYMSVNRQTDIALYWATDPLFYVESIANVMTCKRFKKLMENLHINDNKTAAGKDSPSYDKLHKLRPLCDSLKTSFLQECTASGTHSIDESMIKFKGRNTMKQYMPNKPIKRGYKVWARCESKSGYMYAFEIYTGKKGDSKVCEGLGYKVVVDLCESIEQTGAIVAFDNFFSSFSLMEDLNKKGLFSVGTIKTTSKGLPEVMKSKKLDLKKGEFTYMTKDHTVAYVWKDTKLVHIVSTAHDPNDVVNVKRKQKDGSKQDVNCPAAIMEYTQLMGGVDHFDHLKATYAIGRKSKKWWTRIFYFFVDAALVNAYILYCMINPKKNRSHMDFRIRVARSLIGAYSSRKRKSLAATFQGMKPTNSSQKNVGVPEEIRYANVGSHLPESLEKYARCRNCSRKKHDKRTKIKCSNCNVPLCCTPCFRNFHLK